MFAYDTPIISHLFLVNPPFLMVKPPFVCHPGDTLPLCFFLHCEFTTFALPNGSQPPAMARYSYHGLINNACETKLIGFV